LDGSKHGQRGSNDGQITCTVVTKHTLTGKELEEEEEEEEEERGDGEGGA